MKQWFKSLPEWAQVNIQIFSGMFIIFLLVSSVETLFNREAREWFGVGFFALIFIIVFINRSPKQKRKEKDFTQKIFTYSHKLLFQSSNNYIYIPDEFRPYYRDRVYMTYQLRIGLKIVPEARYVALMSKITELNLEPDNKIQGFIQAGMTELRVKNNIIKIPKEWRNRLGGKDIDTSFTKDEIVVASVRKSMSVYTGERLGDGGAWISLKK